MAAAESWYQGDSRNTLSLSGLVDPNGNPLTPTSAAVKAGIVRVSDGVPLATGLVLNYTGIPGSWAMDQGLTQAAWFPGADTIIVTYTVTDPTGVIWLLTSVAPARPKPPMFLAYQPLSNDTITFVPNNLGSGPSATIGFAYRYGTPAVAPVAMGARTGGGFTSTPAAARWALHEAAIITLVATDSLGIAFTQRILARSTD